MNEGSLKEILPLLRPRSAEPTLFTTTVWYLLWIGLAILVSLYVYRLYRQRKRQHAEFLAVCQEAGISEGQTRLLKRITRARKLKQPERLISSAHTFERQVGAYAQDLAHRHPQHKRLRQIARLREDLGFDQLPTDQALISTRQIDRGQTVMISDYDETTHEEILVPWLVLERDETVMELSPLLHRGTEGHRIRRGEQIDVRFWREGDTEYHFHTLVASVDGENLTVPHAIRIERMQNRDFYRIHVDFPIDLYGLHQTQVEDDAAAIALLDEDAEATQGTPAPEPEDAAEADDDTDSTQIPAQAPRLHGRVENLSAGGLALTILAGSLPPGSVTEEDGEAEWLWMVDPAFEDEFPLAGVACRAVSTEAVLGGQQLVKMQFEALSSTVEKEIVQRVYQHQLDTAGGAPAPMRPRDEEPDDAAVTAESDTDDAAAQGDPGDLPDPPAAG